MKRKQKFLIFFLSFCVFVTGCTNFLPTLESTEETESSIEIPEEWSTNSSFNQGGYYYDHITNSEKAAYEHIYENIVNRQGALLCSADKEDIRTAYESILNDHPEIFYCSGYTLSTYCTDDGNTFLKYETNYSRTAEEQRIDQERIDRVVSQALSNISYDWTTAEKAQYLYEYIVSNTTYKISSIDADNIVSVFCNNLSVCEGYSKAYKYMCDKIGIQCIVVTGYINSSGTAHMWNEISIDNNWYFVDVTWGDTDFKNDDNTPEVRYDYLCVTSEQLLNSHSIDNFVQIPECTNIDANYYKRNNLLLTDFDKTNIQNILFPLNKGDKVTFMCADKNTYSNVYEYLIEDVWIFKYFPESSNIKYSTNASTLTFTFWIDT